MKTSTKELVFQLCFYQDLYYLDPLDLLFSSIENNYLFHTIYEIQTGLVAGRNITFFRDVL